MPILNVPAYADTQLLKIMKMGKYLYDDFILNLSAKFERRFEDIQSDYNFEKGPEFEVAICQVLRSFLPLKYGICRGFVVDKEGNKKGDDIIIYDQDRFPTLRSNSKDDYSRKENIPIEAVYAYIEAKHKIDADSLKRAINQITEVKKLCGKRKQTGIADFDPHVPLKIRGASLSMANDLPPYRNPIYCIVLSKYGVDIKGNVTEDAAEIEHFFESQRFDASRINYWPELIVIGKNFMSRLSTKHENNIYTALNFNYNNNRKREYRSLKGHNISYGLALSHMFSSIDYIRLGKMPWADIIENAYNLNKP